MRYLLTFDIFVNYVYFLGYDKLKPYGFPIHGAIDGYSGKILFSGWRCQDRTTNQKM